MDYYTIIAQRSLLSRSILGRRLDCIRYSEPYSVFLGFEGDKAVKLSCIPDMPYLVSVEHRFIPVKHAHDWHSKRLNGQCLAELSVVHGDRILVFQFESGARLVFEMTGRHANIIVIDPEGIVAGAVRTVNARDSSIREIHPGIPYAPPPPRDFPNLTSSSIQEIARLLSSHQGSIAEALSRTVYSGSRLFAAEALARAGIASGLPAASLSGDDMARLLEAVVSLASFIEQGGSGATIVFTGEGIPQNVFPVKMTDPQFPHEFRDDLNNAVQDYARIREIELERRSIKNAVLESLKRKERRIKSTIAKVEYERGDYTEPGRLERLGVTIMANLNLITKGMGSAVLVDPYGTGEVEVDLDPTLEGPANAKRYFVRARKLRSAALVAEERLSSLNTRLVKILADQKKVAELHDIDGLKTMASVYLRRQESIHAPQIDERFPRRFTSVTGLDIVVGRSDEENDDLVRWARKTDLWLHAQNSPGSHVILRAPGKQSPDWMSVEQAASVAAYYSKEKNAAIVPVVCTPIKYVVKRRGQGPGKVTYTREKVIFAKPGKPETKELSGKGL